MDAFPSTTRAEARRLRQDEGLSLGEIGVALGISPATARRWTLDIELTSHQLARITARRVAAARAGSIAMSESCRQARLAWQIQGREKARGGDALHQAGCLLYWAEGTKNRNRLQFANSDIQMTRLFLRFLRDCFGIGPDDLTLRLNVYTGNGLTLGQIEDHWLTNLGLPRTCLRKHYLNKRPAPHSGRKKGKLPYGVCCLSVLRSTWLVQQIYGGIHVYGGFDEPCWLD